HTPSGGSPHPHGRSECRRCRPPRWSSPSKPTTRPASGGRAPHDLSPVDSSSRIAPRRGELVSPVTNWPYSVVSKGSLLPLPPSPPQSPRPRQTTFRGQPLKRWVADPY